MYKTTNKSLVWLFKLMELEKKDGIHIIHICICKVFYKSVINNNKIN